MTSAAAQNIGRTLGPVGDPRAATHRDRGKSADSRQQILAIVRQYDQPVGVEQLCALTGLHANTVRGHLEVLLAAGDVHRQPGPKRGRGRPPLLYSAGPGEDSVYAEVTRALSEQLGAAAGADVIDAAATRWAEMVDRRTPAETPDEAVEQAAEVLSRLGFEATVSPVGDEIVVHTCPYLALVREEPVICDIHTALLDEVFPALGPNCTRFRDGCVPASRPVSGQVVAA